MHSFEYHCPTEIIFGRGAENSVAEKICKYGGSRVLILYGGGSAVKSGLIGKIERLLGGFEVKTLGGVKPNPRLSFAREAVRAAIDSEINFVLAVGGGSVIDTAKAVAFGAANPDVDIWEHWMGKVKLKRSLPVGAVLTIAAAGSETSDSAVLTDEESGLKRGSITPRPVFAIMNPEFALTVPHYPMICGIADIIMHTLERYFSKIEGNEFTDMVAESLIKNVMAQSKSLLKNPQDLHAMSEIMWCGSVSHTGFTGLGRDRDFSAHKLGHDLSGRYDVIHGASLTTVWASWARTVYTVKPERFANFAEKVFGITGGTIDERARAGIDAMENYFRELGTPTNFSELGIGVQSEDELNLLADMVTSNGTKKVATFQPLDKALVLEIYRKANH
ncbi:MAG: iron-containing alcohol dehydrogenase [Selenomonadaceae bacterium]|nr:iron-containing alcohol dehydrogenase [Selenomonadaceae bacterium]MBQ7493770.1 iron-containing alcohol dehydrogenase [Selenomonadaceae bacterium]